MQQLDLFPTELFLRRIEPERNMWRYYLLRIEPDLFGEWCLRRRWGRIGTYGQEKLSGSRAPELLMMHVKRWPA